MAKRLLIFILLSTLFLTGCGLFGKKDETPEEAPPADAGHQEQVSPKYNIAVLLPDELEHKWERSGRYIKETLESWSYGVEVYYADCDEQIQADQINTAISKKVNCIVVAPIDSYSAVIRDAVEAAGEAGIPVIAYDRLVMNTEYISIYVAFDPYLCGRMSGQYLEKLLNTGKKPNIEIFAAEREDSSASYFYAGAMDVLMPHIDEGRINVPSGLTGYGQTTIGGDSTLSSREIMEAVLGSYYGMNNKVDGVLAANDNIALGVIKALEYAGYTDSFPTVTGAGCYNENMLKLIEGKQSMSIFKDERVIAETVAEAADQIVHGSFPPAVDRILFNNGSKIVPSILLEPVVVDKDNYKTLLIGGEYYSYTDLNP